jgi:hypothetical protein
MSNPFVAQFFWLDRLDFPGPAVSSQTTGMRMYFNVSTGSQGVFVWLGRGYLEFGQEVGAYYGIECSLLDADAIRRLYPTTEGVIGGKSLSVMERPLQAGNHCRQEGRPFAGWLKERGADHGWRPSSP